MNLEDEKNSSEFFEFRRIPYNLDGVKGGNLPSLNFCGFVLNLGFSCVSGRPLTYHHWFLEYIG